MQERLQQPGHSKGLSCGSTLELFRKGRPLSKGLDAALRPLSSAARVSNMLAMPMDTGQTLSKTADQTFRCIDR
jgi:hypothetical protein